MINIFLNLYILEFRGIGTKGPKGARAPSPFLNMVRHECAQIEPSTILRNNTKTNQLSKS